MNMPKGHTRKPHFANDGVRHATINGHRFHLRLQADGGSMLWINGQQPPYQLDKVATDTVGLLIDGMWQFQQGDGNESQKVIDYVVEKIMAKYGRPFALKSRNRVTRRRVMANLHRIFGTVMSLAEGACPADIGLSSWEINPQTWTAPARMDLALTYRCNLKCGKCYNGERQSLMELPTNDWLSIYGILWQIGIPQVVFTGGEPTLRGDLVTLVSEADEFVTGLVTNGTMLADLAQPLRDASLDYVQITIESSIESIHESMTQMSGSFARTVQGIESALEVGLQVVTNTTLTKQNAGNFTDTIKWLHAMGIEHVACNTLICSGRGNACKEENGLGDEELKSLLIQACNTADNLGIELQWYSPGCYTAINPIDLGLGQKSCSAAAHNMLIQPDGTVLPCQSWPDSVGNILTDPWPTIWSHETCKKLRDHLLSPVECKDCADFAVCGGGCPLDKSPRHVTGEGVEC